MQAHCLHKANLNLCQLLMENFFVLSEYPPIYQGKDAILGIYYNVLYPEEQQIEEQNLISSWLQSDGDHFPFSKSQFQRTASFFLGRTPVTVLESIFAGQILDSLNKNASLSDSFDTAFAYIKTQIIPRYLAKAKIVMQLIGDENVLLVKERYEILHDSIMSCYDDPEKELSNSKKKYLDYYGQDIFNSLLESAVRKGKELRLPISNRWDHRIVSLKETIKKVINLAPNAPYFLALQEVTPQSLEDLKIAFPDLKWISYNTTTGEETRNTGHEKILGEFLSFTATVALSPELEVVRVEHGPLPSVSGSLRRIMGVEVCYKSNKMRLVIFTIHTDYLVKDNLYDRNVDSISEFVQNFIKAENLPFIFGGDLNVFSTQGGDEYIKNIQQSGPFIGGIDYREGTFYSPASIGNSTFLGHTLDSFKESFEEREGELAVRSNALDHIFLKNLKVIFSLREAGVYDETGHVIDPYVDPDNFMRRLMERKTASDHFLNGVLFQ